MDRSGSSRDGKCLDLEHTVKVIAFAKRRVKVELNLWKDELAIHVLVVSDSFVTPWPVAHQAPPSMGFSRQEYWSGLPLPSPVASHRVWETCRGNRLDSMLWR